jgi:hypothetical protein
MIVPLLDVVKSLRSCETIACRLDDGLPIGTYMIEFILNALAMAGAMGWEILWPLILGFTLSGIAQRWYRTAR